VVEGDGLENRSAKAPGVRIPPPPQTRNRSRQELAQWRSAVPPAYNREMGRPRIEKTACLAALTAVMMAVACGGGGSAGGTGGAGGTGTGVYGDFCPTAVQGSCGAGTACGDYAGESSADLAAVKSACMADAFGLMWSDHPCDISQAYGGCMMIMNGVCTINWTYASGSVGAAADCQGAGGTWVFGRL
jgi:hypothetical protein